MIFIRYMMFYDNNYKEATTCSLLAITVVINIIYPGNGLLFISKKGSHYIIYPCTFCISHVNKVVTPRNKLSKEY